MGIELNKELYTLTKNKIYLEENAEYEFSADGKRVEVRKFRVSKCLFNRPFPGYQRALDQTEISSYVVFYGSGEKHIKVACKDAFENPVVQPLSKGVSLEKNGNEVSFTLKENGQYVLRLGSYHKVIHIFYNEEKAYPSEATYYFGPGVHFAGRITLKDNESVYVHNDAYVFGCVFAENAKNISIYGGGVLDDSGEERVSASIYANQYMDYTVGNIKLKNCENIKIQDVLLTNAATWCLALFECKNAVIDNVKIAGQWRYNNDGIDLTNCCDIKVKNSFVRSFDDGICIKAISDFGKVENISVENCVVWCDWGMTLEIGAETAADEICNCEFINCDCIHNTANAIDIQNACAGDVHDLKYENISVEIYDDDKERMEIQETDDQAYVWEKSGTPCAICADNKKAVYGTSLANSKKGDVYGITHDIEFKNIFITSDNKNDVIPIRIASSDKDVIFKNFILDGIYVNGEKVNEKSEKISLTTENAENILFKG